MDSFFVWFWVYILFSILGLVFFFFVVVSNCFYLFDLEFGVFKFWIFSYRKIVVRIVICSDLKIKLLTFLCVFFVMKFVV